MNHPRMNDGSAFVRGMSWLIVLCLLNAQMAQAVAQVNGMATAGQGPTTVAQTYRLLEPLKQALQDSLLDPDGVVLHHDFDAEALTRFVATKIHFQAYAGLLRGARGTLISRAGNALDQSVLLAGLLKDAGLEARVLRGRLAPEDASRLLAQMSGPAQWEGVLTDDGKQKVASWVQQRTGSRPDTAPSRQTPPEVAQSLAAAKAIAASVERIAGGRNGQIQARLIEESRDYFWVEHRLGPGDAWQAAHPAFADAPAPDVAADEVMSESVPDELTHRVRISVWMTSRFGDRESRTELMSPWERPAANAAYLPQTLSVLPYNGKSADSGQSLIEAASTAGLFVLTWNDGIAPGAKVFTLEGQSLPLDALNPAGDFMKQISDQGARAIGALGGLGLSSAQESAQTPVRSLEQLWIEYTIIAPDGSERSHRRYLLDRGADGGRLVMQRRVREDGWADQARAALLQARTLVVGTGPVHPDWLLQQTIDAAESGKATLVALERRAAQADKTSAARLLQGLDPLPDTRWLHYFRTTQTATGFNGHIVSYLHQPLVVSFNHGVRGTAQALSGYEQIDIVFNSRRVLERKGAEWTPRPDGAALAGVFETRQEQRVLELRGGETGGSAFAGLAGVSGFTRISGAAELGRVALPPGARRAAEAELEAGYALLVPDTAAPEHWWRVDPATGTVTGMAIGAGGYGGASAAEYIALVGFAIGTLLFLYGFYKCFQGPGGEVLFCCLVDSALTGILVAVVAAAAAALITSGIGAGAAAVGGSAAEAELVAAIVNAFIFDVSGAALSFTNLQLHVCGG
ncbi:MAG: hypothetical protein Kow0020_07970 [Wenzhouxiangellaceae bacterium]